MKYKVLSKTNKYLISLLINLGLCNIASSDIIYVHQLASGAGNGLSWNNAFTDLQSALDIVVPDDTIWVAEGTYRPGVERENSFTLIDSVVILGGFMGIETHHYQRDPEQYSSILSGNIGDSLQIIDNSYHVININYGTILSSRTKLDGFQISDGNADGDFGSGWGGGLYLGAGSPVISNCIFQNNQAVNGGAIHCGSDSASFINLKISDNSASQGGGAVNLSGGTSNKFINCDFSNNISQRYGGAIALDLAHAEFIGCVFFNNIAIEDRGGAISNYTASHPTIINCTFYGNSALQGGSLWSGGADATIINSILWGNEPDEIFGGFEISVFYSDIQGGSLGETNIDENPNFVNQESGNLRLADTSPCINTGIDTLIWNTDTLLMLDSASYSGPAPDMGAFEYYDIVSISPHPELSRKYVLPQNYPNPFNPTTTISYVLPETSEVKLTIFDITGRQVANLTDDIQPAGNYDLQWNGIDGNGIQVITGVYFCRLEAGEFSQTIKMVYLR